MGSYQTQAAPLAKSKKIARQIETAVETAFEERAATLAGSGSG